MGNKFGLGRKIFNQFFIGFILLTFIFTFLELQLLKYFQNSFLVLAAVFLISVVVFYLIAKIISRRITHPIKKLSAKIVENVANPSEFEKITDEYYSELGDIVFGFNSIGQSLSECLKLINEYKSIEENLGFGVFELDSNFKIVNCNQGLVRIFEKEKCEQIIGEKLSEFITIDKKMLEKAKEEGITLREIEVNLPYEKYVMLNIKPLKNEGEQTFIASIKDISKDKNEEMARSALELALIKSNRLAEIGEKVEGIVHNINTPLNSIFGFLQLLKKEFGENDDINKIISAARNISEMIKGLLTKAKQDYISTITSFNINDAVKQEIEQCKNDLFFKHSVFLQTDLSDDLPNIKAVCGDISQCISNIMNNAIDSLKFTMDKFIWVKTYKTLNMVAVEIKDSGKGIEEENLDKIFEPYFSTKNGDRNAGFGLGLTICKNIARKYLGYISVSSRVGFGSTFTLFLPFEKE